MEPVRQPIGEHGDTSIIESTLGLEDEWLESDIKELWIPAKIQGRTVMLCVDSGASKITLTPEQYSLIPEDKRLPLSEREVYLRQADGSRVKIMGATGMEVQVGSHVEIVEVYVAQVSDNLLGINYLRKCGAKLDFSSMQLIINGERVDCRTRDNKPLCARLTTVEEIRIPAEHEMVIPVCLADNRKGRSVCLVEPTYKGMEDDEFIVARAVVDAGFDTIPVRVMNLSTDEKVLKEGTVIARLVQLEEEDVEDGCEESACRMEEIGADLKLPDHLEELYEKCTTHLDPRAKEEVLDLLINYQDVFSRGEFDIGRTPWVKHSIDTQGAQPIRQPLRRSSPTQRAEVERQVSELLDRGLIEPSDSPWASPVVLVSKKDGSKRLCLDYRKLNEVSVKCAYPLPRIDDSLDALGEAKYFSTLDLASGYWQVEMDSDARDKSAFVTTSGLYAWNVLPFGLCNAPSTFERLMDGVLAGLRWETLLVYLDDVIVFGRSIPESIERLATVFGRFRNAGLKVKPSKCALLQKEVEYLGHIVSEKGIHTSPDKIAAVRDWPTPVTQTQVRSFLGLASYYRRFIRGFAEIAAPLHRLTEKSAKFQWTEDCDKAFDTLRQALISAPILAYPRAEGQYVLDTDASNFAIGCVLSQVQDGEEKVISYGSRSLQKPERNYCVTRKELLAIVAFLKKYRHYLCGAPVKVRTDHGSLRWLCNFKNPEGQLARWLEVLANFHLKLEYRPGKRHQNADGLSRRPCKQCGRWEEQVTREREENRKRKKEAVEAGIDSDEIAAVRKNEMGTQTEVEDLAQSCSELVDTPMSTGSGSGDSEACGTMARKNPELERAMSEMMTFLDDKSKELDHAGEMEDQNLGEIEEDTWIRRTSAIPEVSVAAIREAQLADETMAPIVKWKESEGERPKWEEIAIKSAALKTYWGQWEALAVRKGVLMKRWESEDGKEFKWLLVLPKSLRKKVLDSLHSSKTAGHLGREKTLPKVRGRFYWVGMSVDVRAYVKRCADCARKKNPPRKSRAPLKQLPVGAPLERVAIDVLGPLTETHQGNSYILVVGDYWTKWMETYPIPDQQAETVAAKLVEEFVCRFGVPEELHSDQGRNFESAVFQEMCRLLGIRKTRTTPYNPKSDGMVERYNRTIVNAVSLMILPHQHQKDWDEYLPYVGFAYRSSIQASTGESPNMMMLGREVSAPVDVMFGKTSETEEDCTTDYGTELREKLQGIHERARHALKVSSRRQKRNYDRRARGPVYKKDQFVWLFNVQRKASMSKKLMLPWEGPYLIIAALSDVTFRIQKTARSKPRVVHADRLKPYEGPELPSWNYEQPVPVEISADEVVDTDRVQAKDQDIGEQQIAGGPQELLVTEERSREPGRVEVAEKSREEVRNTEDDSRTRVSDVEEVSPGSEDESHEACHRDEEGHSERPGEQDGSSVDQSSGEDSKVKEPIVSIIKKRKKVTINPEVRVIDIPACGKGRKYPDKTERKVRKRWKQWLKELGAYDKVAAHPGSGHGGSEISVGRRNPSRDRRMPARYL